MLLRRCSIFIDSTSSVNNKHSLKKLKNSEHNTITM